MTQYIIKSLTDWNFLRSIRLIRAIRNFNPLIFEICYLDPLHKDFPLVKLQNFWRDEVKILRNIQRIF